ncbi:hypothetical protein [Oceaniglobus trochenteri]|uniref:hypothetical protein n=1 Tax=Oceaniglobus trochenteri TaxID=2763260 RepID=UPI001CFF655E|nr:hypothetical protein [Oceaniglobus trochenteri]
MGGPSRRAALALLAAAGGGFALGSLHRPARLPGPVAVAAAYQTPLPTPRRGLNVFHLGHSLVGRDMPAMLAQLAGEGHRYHSQLGQGTALRQHWYPGLPVQGFASENAHDRFRPAHGAIGSGDYDAVILTEMVELLDALKYHESGPYLTRWADLARGANPTTRVYLYETWHGLDDSGGFLARLDADIERLWVGELLAHDLSTAPPRPIHLIPAGQVLARVVRAIESDPLPGLARREDLFALAPDGSRDPIHLNDIGAYLVAVTHFATLYHRPPLGLPHRLLRADGTPADAPGAAAAALIQRLAWEVVRADPRTGVPA